MYIMSDNEIAGAWLKSVRELKALELEIAGLESEIKRSGEALIEVGKVFLKTPDLSGNIDTVSLAEDIRSTGERARRYTDLLLQRASKKSEVEKFENAS
jgi:hypothetical protein